MSQKQELSIQSHTTNIQEQIKTHRYPEMITDKAEKKLQGRGDERTNHNTYSGNVDAFTISEMKRKLDVMLKQTEAWENLHARKLSMSRSSRNLSNRSSERRSMRESRGNSLLVPKWRIPREQENYSCSYQQSEDDRDSIRSITKSTATDRENKKLRVSRKRELISQDRESSCILSTRNKEYLEISPIYNTMENPEGELHYEDEQKSHLGYENVLSDERSQNANDDDFKTKEEAIDSMYYEEIKREKKEEEKLKELEEKYELLTTQNKALLQNFKQIEITNKTHIKNIEKENEELQIISLKYEETEQKLKHSKEEKEYEKQQIILEFEKQIKNIENETNINKNNLQKYLEEKETHFNKLLTINYNQNSNSEIEETQNESNHKESIISNIQIKLIEIKEFESKIKEANQKINILNSKTQICNQEIETLKQFQSEIDSEKYQSFDCILMTQIQEISSLKQEIEQKSEEIFETKEKLTETETKYKTIENEHKIIEMKQKSEINNKKLVDSINDNEQDNIIDHLNKKIQTLEDKYLSSVSEIKIKNNFLKQHLIGRAEMETEKKYIEDILEKVNNEKLW